MQLPKVGLSRYFLWSISFSCLTLLIFPGSSAAQRSRWRSLGPFEKPLDGGGSNATGIGRVNCITFHPDYGKKNAIIYAGMPTAGLYKSTDNGSHWKKVNTDLPLEGVSDITFDARNKKVIYLASGDRDGIPDKFRPDGVTEFSQSQGIAVSKNGGKSWKANYGTWNNDSSFWNYPSHKNITSIVSTRHATFTSLYYLNSKRGTFDSYVFQSKNQGRTWEMCLMTDSIMLREMVVMPGNDKVIFAAGEKLYMSDRKGQPGTWTTVDLGNRKYSRIELASTPLKLDIIYMFASVENSGDVDLMTCNERGEIKLVRTYEHFYSGEPRFCFVLEASNKSDELYFGNLPVYKIDSSRTIKMVSNWYSVPSSSSFVHADVHALRAAPDSNVIYVGHDGGISRSRDGGQTWEDISNGLDIAKFYRLTCSQETGNVMTGTQDVGTMIYDSSQPGNNKWRCVRGGDGGDCIISHSDTVLIHSDGQNNVLAASLNGGKYWRSITPRGERGDFIKPVKQHPNEPNTIFAGFHDVYKSPDLGKTWKKISDLNQVDKEKKLVVMEISPSDPDVIYAGYEGPLWSSEVHSRKGILFTTTDGGKTWNDITLELTGVHWTQLEALAIDPESPQTVFAGFGQAWEYKVMRSDDGGKHWINYSEGLTARDGVNTLMTYKRKVYVGTHLGVYVRDIDKSSEWKKISQGLPNVPVYDLDMYKKENLLRACTNGRGVWECVIDP